MRMPLAGCALVAAFCLGGCAGASDGASRLFVDPARYDLYDCKQLAAARKTSAQQVGELQGLMAKAEQGAAGALVSGIAYQSEYRVASANLDLIDQNRRRSNCAESELVDTAPTSAPLPVRKRTQ